MARFFPASSVRCRRLVLYCPGRWRGAGEAASCAAAYHNSLTPAGEAPCVSVCVCVAVPVPGISHARL